MHHGHCCCYNVVTVAARAPVVVVTLLLLLLLVAVVPGHAVFDVYADEVMDVAMLEDGSSCHFRMTPPVVPESPEERREHYRVMEAKDLGRHRRKIMAEGTSSSGSGSSSAAEEDLNLMPVPKLMSTSATDMTELMASTSTFEMPMRSALTVVDVGMYLVTVLLGTPALPYSMALDTANDLTWVNCRLRGHRRHRDRGRRRPPPIKPPSTVTIMSMDDASDPVNTAAAAPAVDKSAGGKYVRSWYRPAQSRSWRRYRCSQADSCGLFPHNDCQSNLHNESCTYESRTQDGTVTRGIYGSETATVAVSGGRMARLPGLVLGCSTYEAGGAVAMHDGILTLGNQDVSFGTVAARHFKGRFSFCLLPTRSFGNASSYLTFGPNPAMAAGARETRIVYNPLVPAFGVHVTGLFINGKRLDIPPEVWQEDNKGGGLHIDTGTSLTGLVEPAYGEVTRAITRHLAHLKKEDITGFDHCYWWTFTGDDGVDPAHNVTIPRLEIEFEGGARLDPGAKGVVVPEAAPGVVCVAFRRRELGPSVLGNVQMQDHIWEVDHLNGVLRFKKDTCLNHNLPPPPPPSSPPAPKS
uniref:Uncharacterized protein n=1 Tax=Avena sativa TaxID=4498 RepID=A0ACD5T6G4_AVESA